MPPTSPKSQIVSPLTIPTLFVLFILTLAACVSQAPPAPTETIAWRTLEAGKREALEKNMPVLVDFFYGTGCSRCMAVQRDIYNDPDLVAMINREFIPVRVWLTAPLSPEEKKLSDELKNGEECILAFLDSHGQVIKDKRDKYISSMGMLPAKEYRRYMELALEQITNE